MNAHYDNNNETINGLYEKIQRRLCFQNMQVGQPVNLNCYPRDTKTTLYRLSKANMLFNFILSWCSTIMVF